LELFQFYSGRVKPNAFKPPLMANLLLRREGTTYGGMRLRLLESHVVILRLRGSGPQSCLAANHYIRAAHFSYLKWLESRV
jgi:hypothetical protein